ncbi:hypothetical protein OSB04_un000762 [Centaurea solstitialis]|uniref:Uncharacterized protein n=1 Tax=Centaurea solstitialis TaxID=347529 RepID=A0AA38VRJ6_9ASTR|nr:hypothetical protein OSB04_un000762 [Centaurea solstitialis]
MLARASFDPVTEPNNPKPKNPKPIRPNLIWFGYRKVYNESAYARAYGTYVDKAIMEWQGNERELTSTLRLLTSIDLSSNHLMGQIPNELTALHELLVKQHSTW